MSPVIRRGVTVGDRARVAAEATARCGKHGGELSPRLQARPDCDAGLGPPVPAFDAFDSGGD